MIGELFASEEGLRRPSCSSSGRLSARSVRAASSTSRVLKAQGVRRAKEACSPCPSRVSSLRVVTEPNVRPVGQLRHRATTHSVRTPRGTGFGALQGTGPSCCALDVAENARGVCSRPRVVALRHVPARLGTEPASDVSQELEAGRVGAIDGLGLGGTGLEQFADGDGFAGRARGVSSGRTRGRAPRRRVSTRRASLRSSAGLRGRARCVARTNLHGAACGATVGLDHPGRPDVTLGNAVAGNLRVPLFTVASAGRTLRVGKTACARRLAATASTLRALGILRADEIVFPAPT